MCACACLISTGRQMSLHLLQALGLDSFGHCNLFAIFQFAPPSCAKEQKIQFWTPENGFCRGIWFDFKEELWLITILLFMIFQYIWHWLELVNWMRSGWFHLQWRPHRPFERFSSLDYNTMTKWRADGPWQDLLSRFYFNSTPGARIEPNGFWIFNQYKLTLRDVLRANWFAKRLAWPRSESFWQVLKRSWWSTATRIEIFHFHWSSSLKRFHSSRPCKQHSRSCRSTVRSKKMLVVEWLSVSRHAVRYHSDIVGCALLSGNWLSAVTAQSGKWAALPLCGTLF